MSNGAQRESQGIRRRSGVALVMTLLLVVLAAAVSARLVATAGIEAVRTHRSVNTLQHGLAVDSAIRVAAVHLDRRSPERGPDGLLEADPVTFTLGECVVWCRIADDGGKFNVAAFATPEQDRTLASNLRRLQRSLSLPAARVDLRPSEAGPDEPAVPRYVWFDQVLADRSPDGVFRDPADASEDTLAWSDVVTFFGDGRVDVRRARPEVLRAVLADVGPQAADAILAARHHATESATLAELLQKVGPEDRERVQSRIALDLQRYALTIETRIGSDCRRWYVVATLAHGRVQHVNYRGQIVW
ncbi:MAG: hypothetical protein JXB13_01520 [Phycisphaerae bacterium]|nr:hypothetical protein [Phycisphaerae bacterium]